MIDTGTCVTLTWTELQHAAFVGCQRVIRGFAYGRRERFNPPKDGVWSRGVIGAAGEMAVAKHLGMFWADSRDPDRAGDVGPYHVRSTIRDDGCLILHPDPDDPGDARFVLVTGVPPTFRLAGWLYARDGKTAEYWRTDVREPCFMVPQHQLLSMEQWPRTAR